MFIFTSVIKEKRTNRKKREYIHQGLMNAWWRIHYMPASDCTSIPVIDRIQRTPPMTISRHQNHKRVNIHEQTTIECFTLRRNPIPHGTTISINLSQDGLQQSIWERWEDTQDRVIVCISHRGDFLHLFFLIQIALPFIPYHTDSLSTSTD